MTDHCQGCYPHPCECTPSERRLWAAFDGIAAQERAQRAPVTPSLPPVGRKGPPEGAYVGPPLPAPQWDRACGVPLWAGGTPFSRGGPSEGGR